MEETAETADKGPEFWQEEKTRVQYPGGKTVRCLGDGKGLWRWTSPQSKERQSPAVTAYEGAHPLVFGNSLCSLSSSIWMECPCPSHLLNRTQWPNLQTNIKNTWILCISSLEHGQIAPMGGNIKIPMNIDVDLSNSSYYYFCLHLMCVTFCYSGICKMHRNVYTKSRLHAAVGCCSFSE